MNFDRAAAVYRYQGVVCTAIVAAKYPRNTVLSRELSMRLAVESCRRWPCLIDQTSNERGPCELPTLVTSVPSPTWRQMRRGGSGTQVLARYFARWVRQAGGNVRYRSLLKTTRQISKQAWLDDQERRENVQGAFKLSPWIDWIRPLSSAPGVPRGESLSKQPLLGRDVILVDDVMTTGATANEIAGVLKAAGANRVSLAIVARAVRQS
ncbi:MAG: ComF family protein [Rubripirellula sp.]